MTTPINGLVARQNLTEASRDEMFHLLSHYFEGVTRAQFEQDLAEKNWVIEIREKERLLGFSTLLFLTKRFEGREFAVIYSGDTIVAPEGWRKPTLARTWIAAVNHLRQSCPELRCYWLLLTSGFRTYRFLPVFWKEFHPQWNISIPESEQQLLDFLAEEQYGESYNRKKGIVRFPNPQKLKGSLAFVPNGREPDNHVSFFLSRNPGHSEGEELVCLTEISDMNLTPAGIRMIAPQ